MEKNNVIGIILWHNLFLSKDKKKDNRWVSKK